jgi:hypothetical protein
MRGIQTGVRSDVFRQDVVCCDLFCSVEQSNGLLGFANSLIWGTE